ncbi:hypothetical protein MJC1_04183 [Methylocystis sp. MJC1]|jgi:hypothetical protein|nr:hypothetical protein MJC1_04183 [Methylocystis sp. MJC1]
MRRGRENQSVSERFERATPIWTRSAYFHEPVASERPHYEVGHANKPDHMLEAKEKQLAFHGVSTHETHSRSQATSSLIRVIALGEVRLRDWWKSTEQQQGRVGTISSTC